MITLEMAIKICKKAGCAKKKRQKKKQLCRVIISGWVDDVFFTEYKLNPQYLKNILNRRLEVKKLQREILGYLEGRLFVNRNIPRILRTMELGVLRGKS